MVIRPLSNALSCRGFRHRPFLGFVFSVLSSLTFHGFRWLAIYNFSLFKPVIQHWLLYAASTALLK